MTNVMGIGGRSGNVCNFFLCFVFLPFLTDLKNEIMILQMYQHTSDHSIGSTFSFIRDFSWCHNFYVGLVEGMVAFGIAQ